MSRVFDDLPICRSVMRPGATGRRRSRLISAARARRMDMKLRQELDRIERR